MRGIFKFLSQVPRLGFGALQLVAVATLWVGCSADVDQSGSRRFQLTWPQSDGTYALDDRVTIDTLDDVKGMQGRVATIKVQPGISDGSFTGASPSAKFMKTSEGVLVPLDFMSHQMAAIYAHLERLWQLDQRLGISDRMIYPKLIGVGMQVSIKGYASKVTNNALYYQPTDGILFVPFDQSKIPISVNAGAIAHEYFHSIFQRFVAAFLGKLADDQLSERMDANITSESELALGFAEEGGDSPKVTAPSLNERYHRVLIRALNEGLADFWGWIYSGDDFFVAKSLPELLAQRRLDRESRPLLDTVRFKTDVSHLTSVAQANAYAYQKAADYAVFLRNMALDIFGGEALRDRTARIYPFQTEAVRAKAAKWFVESLPRLKDLMVQSLKNNSTITTDVLVTALFTGSGAQYVSKDVCLKVREFAPSAAGASGTCF